MHYKKEQESYGFATLDRLGTSWGSSGGPWLGVWISLGSYVCSWGPLGASWGSSGGYYTNICQKNVTNFGEYLSLYMYI